MQGNGSRRRSRNSRFAILDDIGDNLRSCKVPKGEGGVGENGDILI